MESNFNIDLTYDEVDEDFLDGEFNFSSEISETLQRSQDWFAERVGKWTASKYSDLMSCNRRSAKLSWNDNNKIYEFGETFENLIFSRAMERIMNFSPKTATTKVMNFGTIMESFVFKRVKQKFPEYIFEEVGFKENETNFNSGASSDLIAKDLSSKEIIMSVEVKNSTNWETYKKRVYEKTNDKSIDFWQQQGQMMAWNVNKCLYITISPVQDIDLYLYSENLEELYDHWISETIMNCEIVEKSEIHCEALSLRIDFAENICELFQQNYNKGEKTPISELISDNIDEFKRKIQSKTDVEDSKKVKEVFVEKKYTETEIIQKDFVNYEQILPARMQGGDASKIEQNQQKEIKEEYLL